VCSLTVLNKVVTFKTQTFKGKKIFHELCIDDIQFYLLSINFFYSFFFLNSLLMYAVGFIVFVFNTFVICRV